MASIQVLSKETIEKIAAGEVIERPMSVVKELVENAVDAGANAITVEIRGGGKTYLRVTDNGSGIAAEEVRTAFLPHATSKIKDAADLISIGTLGFRGEALSSIAAISRVEILTKTNDAITGIRYLLEGSEERGFEEIGCPAGTTFIVRDLFFNTPARQKFLKSDKTEGTYIASLIERMALAHPEISFRFLSEGKARLETSGNRREQDVIYHVFGKEVAGALLPVDMENEVISIHGYIGKPTFSRGNRNFENYFVNGRYIKSNILNKGIDDAYHSYLMQHQYPFTVLHFTVAGEEIDVNVHPQKMELRFSNSAEVYRSVAEALRQALERRELIPEVPAPYEEEKPTNLPSKKHASIPEPFEKNRLDAYREIARKTSDYGTYFSDARPMITAPLRENKSEINNDFRPEKAAEKTAYVGENSEQLSLPFVSEGNSISYEILGQVFDTYWLVAFQDKLVLIDQHAAHEKVNFERLMKRKALKTRLSQQLSPGFTLTLSIAEEACLLQYQEELMDTGYAWEHFGGRDYCVTAVPADLYGLDEQQYFISLLDDLAETGRVRDTEALYMKIATMSCKAAIKGNHRISRQEFETLLQELFALKDPYHCPHGRPTMISMTRYELDRKFRRIV